MTDQIDNPLHDEDLPGPCTREDWHFMQDYLHLPRNKDPRDHPRFKDAIRARAAYLRADAERHMRTAAAFEDLYALIKKHDAENLQELKDRGIVRQVRVDGVEWLCVKDATGEWEPKWRLVDPVKVLQ